jgi:hypothetical protein
MKQDEGSSSFTKGKFDLWFGSLLGFLLPFPE